VLKGLLTFGLTRRPIVLLGLLVFVGAGLAAFSRLNIEAYPNPAPVILEITAQSAGLSAEEMERYYTIPIEVGLAATPGVEVIRSTSFYGLAFVRVVFQYSVDYYFALTQTQINLQQNVNLPNSVTPQIQGTSLVGEIFRYQVVGPPHFGLTNLRTVQDWVLQRRLLTVPGVVQVNTWGGTTKEYEVEVDLAKLDAYNVTLPQVISAIGGANVNVGGRTINIGQQSVNVRGVGLMDAGGGGDLTQGAKVEDIENVLLFQSKGVPVFVKDVAKVYVGNVPRLGKAGRDNEDDVVAAIVIMNRTLHTNDVVARARAEVERINNDGTLPPGVKLVPFYDRSPRRPMKRTRESSTTRLAKQGLALDPEEPELLNNYSQTLRALGYVKESLRVREQLALVEPFNALYNRQTAEVMLANGKIDAGLKALEALHGAAIATATLSRTYAWQGRLTEAADALLQTPVYPNARPMFEAAARLLRSAADKTTPPMELPVFDSQLNFVYAYIGGPECMLDWPDKARRSGDYRPILSLWWSLLSSVRKTERFKRFARDAGMADYWHAHGWPDLCHPVEGDDFVCD
jgi:hypothetical protein